MARFLLGSIPDRREPVGSFLYYLASRYGVAFVTMLPSDPAIRREVFERPEKIVFEVGRGFIDLYALLLIRRDASRAEIEEAIVSRGADLLALLFSRGGKNEVNLALEAYLPHFRPILLDAGTRRAYDEQLRWHECGDARAQDYAQWSARQLSRANQAVIRLKSAPGTVWRRIGHTLLTSEYL